MQNLGYVNGWDETPEIVKKCEEKNHKRDFKEIGSCKTKCICEECGYTYKIDSSD